MISAAGSSSSGRAAAGRPRDWTTATYAGVDDGDLCGSGRRRPMRVWRRERCEMAGIGERTIRGWGKEMGFGPRWHSHVIICK
jgi:hypothetical protein